jgi:hypothetical protein
LGEKQRRGSNSTIGEGVGSGKVPPVPSLKIAPAPKISDVVDLLLEKADGDTDDGPADASLSMGLEQLALAPIKEKPAWGKIRSGSRSEEKYDSPDGEEEGACVASRRSIDAVIDVSDR